MGAMPRVIEVQLDLKAGEGARTYHDPSDYEVEDEIWTDGERLDPEPECQREIQLGLDSYVDD
jgi:hypothetical protein